MNFIEFHENFLEFESRNSLFRKEINGVRFWERIRQNINRKLLKEASDDWGDISTNNIHPIESQHKLIKNLINKNPYFARKSDILFWGHERRKLRSDGYWWDLFCDPVIEELDWDYVYLEKPDQHNHHRPAKTDNIRYMDMFVYSGDVQKFIGDLIFDLSDDNKQMLNRISKDLRQTFETELDLTTYVKKDLAKREMLLPLYKKLLRKINPQIVILAKHINRETFIECCKNLRIPVIELQHSIIHKYHYSYHFEGTHRTKITFPDYFFTYGDYWRDSVDYPISTNNVISVGYPYFESERKKFFDHEPDDSVIFISQPTAGKKLSKFAIEFSNLTEKEVLYKLHPEEYRVWEDVYPWLKNEDIKIIDTNEPPLYELLSKCSFQVGISSTAIFEGIGFNLNTYIIDHPRIKIMDYLINKDMAQVVTSPNHLYDLIKNGDKLPNTKSNYIFKNNATENIVEEISNILESQ